VAARSISVLSYPLYVHLSVVSVYAEMRLQSVATLVYIVRCIGAAFVQLLKLCFLDA
jgi:hypothetical protein